MLSSTARIKRLLYRSLSSKEDWYDVMPLKLLCIRSLPVNRAWTKRLPERDVYCMLELMKSESDIVEKSSMHILALMLEQCVLEIIMCCRLHP